MLIELPFFLDSSEIFKGSRRAFRRSWIACQGERSCEIAASKKRIFCKCLTRSISSWNLSLAFQNYLSRLRRRKQLKVKQQPGRISCRYSLRANYFLESSSSFWPSVVQALVSKSFPASLFSGLLQVSRLTIEAPTVYRSPENPPTSPRSMKVLQTVLSINITSRFKLNQTCNLVFL